MASLNNINESAMAYQICPGVGWLLVDYHPEHFISMLLIPGGRQAAMSICTSQLSNCLGTNAMQPANCEIAQDVRWRSCDG